MRIPGETAHRFSLGGRWKSLRAWIPEAQLKKLTKRARNALLLAQQCAQRERDGVISAGDLLLGLAGEEGGLAAQALHDAGLDLAHMEAISGAPADLPEDAWRDDEGTFAMRILAAAEERAGQLGHDYVGTEHLLLALVDRAGDALRRLDVDPEHVRALVQSRLS